MKYKYKIPENKKDITITQFNNIVELQKKAEEEETEVNEKQVLSICLNLPLYVINELPINDYAKAIENINNILSEKSSFINRFKYKGIEFGFIPSLEDITAGEYAAIDTFLNDTNKNHLDLINVLYREIEEEKEFKNWWSKEKIKTYTIKGYNSKVDVNFFKDLPYEIYEGALFFFYNLGKDLLTAIQSYMKATEAKQMNYQNHLVKNGGGFKHLTHTLQRLELKTMKYNMSQSVKYYLD
tara:strand:+ start:428 stop:1147 length:720 start_codon:yes stop_codon:yes gene_type:complete